MIPADKHKWLNEDKVVITYRVRGQRCHLHRIFVPPRKRGKGLATKAMLQFLQEAKLSYDLVTMVALSNWIADWNDRLGMKSTDHKHYWVDLKEWTSPIISEVPHEWD